MRERKRPAPEVVASAVSAVEPEPKTREPSARDVRPVPPPATLSVPEIVGVRVKVPEELVMVSPKVRPLKETAEEVASVMAPVCAEE